MKRDGYWDEEYAHLISPDDLREMETDEQVDVMRRWFNDNYEDPVHSRIYISREGGYQYYFGEPYSADEVLFDEFDQIVPEKVIRNLAGELEGIAWEWVSTRPIDELDTYRMEAVLSNTAPRQTFGVDIFAVEEILDGAEKFGTALWKIICKLLYVNVVTSLETFLSDVFINSMLDHKQYIAIFVENYPKYKHEKIKMSQVFQVHSRITSSVEEELRQMTWHNIERVFHLYKVVFGVEFGDEHYKLKKYVEIRHDLVHRNGKNVRGEVHDIVGGDVEELITAAKRLADHIDSSMEGVDEIGLYDSPSLPAQVDAVAPCDGDDF